MDTRITWLLKWPFIHQFLMRYQGHCNETENLVCALFQDFEFLDAIGSVFIYN